LIKTCPNCGGVARLYVAPHDNTIQWYSCIDCPWFEDLNDWITDFRKFIVRSIPFKLTEFQINSMINIIARGYPID